MIFEKLKQKQRINFKFDIHLERTRARSALKATVFWFQKRNNKSILNLSLAAYLVSCLLFSIIVGLFRPIWSFDFDRSNFYFLKKFYFFDILSLLLLFFVFFFVFWLKVLPLNPERLKLKQCKIEKLFCFFFVFVFIYISKI